MQTETEIKLNTVLYGKSEEKLKKFPDNFFDGIITDPPYGLNFMGKSWDKFFREKKVRSKTPGDRSVLSYDTSSSGLRNFQDWFYKIAVEMLRVSKPGSFLFCFGGTRTHHRVTCAIEDAGWIIKDEFDWLYGEGFPKSTNISKQLDKEAGVEREVVGERRQRANTSYSQVPMNTCIGKKEQITAPATEDAKQWDGYGTGIKPGREPIIVAMKPLEKGLTYAQNAKKWGVAGLNIDGGRIGVNKNDPCWRDNASVRNSIKNSACYGKYNGIELHNLKEQGRWPSNVILSHSPDCVRVGTKIINEGVESGKYSGKEYHVEGFVKTCKANAPHIRGQETVEVYACVPDCPIRILDGQSGILHSGNIDQIINGGQFNVYGKQSSKYVKFTGDSGGASRFFYCAKAKRSEKEAGLIEFVPCVKCGEFDSKTHIVIDPDTGKKKKEKCTRNDHPTVKPLDLMRYLINLIKMPSAEENKQVILDPFCGSGTTLVALEQLGINYVGIDQDLDNCLISTVRIG